MAALKIYVHTFQKNMFFCIKNKDNPFEFYEQN